MTLSQVRYLARWRRHEGALVTSEGEAIRSNGVGDFVAAREVADPISLASLKRALVRAMTDLGGEVPLGGDGATDSSPAFILHLTDVPHEFADEDYIPYLDYFLYVSHSGKLALEVSAYLEVDLLESDVREALKNLLRRYQSTLLFVDYEGVDRFGSWTVRISVERRGRSVGLVCNLAEDVIKLLGLLGGAPAFTLDSLWDLLASGRADILVGRPESSILEVKSQAYDLNQEADKIELSQDVARFANAEHGGVLVLGMRTDKRSGADVISRLTPLLNAAPNIAQRYRAVIDKRVYPPIDLLEIVRVLVAPTGHIVAVKVPPQAEELKPFIVHGALAGGRLEGAFISIVRRRDEGSIPISGPAIHAWLAAGRALMRAGRLPERPE